VVAIAGVGVALLAEMSVLRRLRRRLEWLIQVRDGPE
jgi:hypothetical protein